MHSLWCHCSYLLKNSSHTIHWKHAMLINRCTSDNENVSPWNQLREWTFVFTLKPAKRRNVHGIRWTQKHSVNQSPQPATSRTPIPVNNQLFNQDQMWTTKWHFCSDNTKWSLFNSWTLIHRTGRARKKNHGEKNKTKKWQQSTVAKALQIKTASTSNGNLHTDP